MRIAIQPFTEAWGAAVREFNGRLQAGGRGEWSFPDSPECGSQQFLAVEDGCVRGGYILRTWDFSFDGKVRPVAHYCLPLSEGVIHKAYVGVGGLMLRHALAQQPLLFALGMGGLHYPLPRLLRAMGWSLRQVGFYFRVLRPAPFLRNIRPLRSRALGRVLLDLAAWSGVGWLAIRALQLGRFGNGPSAPAAMEAVLSFGPWADELWKRCQIRYGALAVRNSEVLNRLYSAGEKRFLIWKVARGRQVIGWAVALDTAMRDDQYFGNLRLGSIVDVLALPEDARDVVAAAALALEERGVDLIVSNQSHPAWTQALLQSGFLEGPSNFILAVSNKFAEASGPLEGFHINRGDGDGPIHL